MKHLLCTFLSMAICSFVLNSCLNDPDMKDGVINGSKPEIENFETGVTTATSVYLKAEITKENGIAVVECGFMAYEEGANDTIRRQIPNKKGKGEFADTIVGLTKNTVYKVFAYAINRLNESNYSKVETITTTAGIGIVATIDPDISTIKGTSVTLKGLIDKPGEGDIDACGFYLSKKENMLDKDSISAHFETDTFTYIKTGLEVSTTYYVKAFVRNKYGMFVGAKTKSFKTTDGTAKLSIHEVFDKEYHDVKIKAAVSDMGDSPVMTRGICWGITEKPTIANDTTKNGNGQGLFEGHLTSLSSQKLYYARAYAINSYGVSYSDQISFMTKNDQATVKTYDVVINEENGEVLVKGEVLDQGPSAVLQSGICWSATTTPSISGDHLSLSSGVNAFESVISKLKGGTQYKVCAYATNSEGITIYGNIITFKTPSPFTLMSSFKGGERIPNSSATFTIGSKGFLVGGDTGPQCTDQLWEYDAYYNTWKEKLAFSNGKYKWQTAVGTGNFGFVFGGTDNTNLTNTVFRYSDNMNSWTEIQTTAGPAPFYSAVGIVPQENEIYLVGGARDTITNEVWLFNKLNKWERKGNFPIKQYRGVGVTWGNRLYAGLGMINMDGDVTNRLWTSSGDMNTWTEETTMPGGGKAKGGVIYKSEIYVVDDQGVIRKYNPATKIWKERSKLTAQNKAIHCIYSINNMIYIGLGDNSSDLIRYNPAWDND